MTAFETAKSLIKKTTSWPLKPDQGLTLDDVGEARTYIAKYWKKLERFNPKGDDSLIGLPKPYLVPAYEAGHSFDFNELYYWDSYFMIQALLDGPHKALVLGILEDLISLFERYHVIPNASRTYLTGRSQPPLLTSFIFDVYEAFKLDKQWLGAKMAVAEVEYEVVWMGTHKPHERQVYEGLSRYYDINYNHDLAEAESGWDMTSRFSRHALDYLPVDLNTLLYKYEIDFARTASELGKKNDALKWQAAAERRREAMNRLMWDRGSGLFYDYNFVKQKRGSVSSLAGYYPLWVGLADETQAKKLVKSLSRFEHKGGLAATDTPALSQFVPGAVPMQWAYPNGWAPLHWLVVEGLKRYGYNEAAKRIAMKWLRTNLDWFNKYHVFLEKYNVVQTTRPPAKGLYPSQTGFGWTNSVFEVFCRDFIDRG